MRIIRVIPVYNDATYFHASVKKQFRTHRQLKFDGSILDARTARSHTKQRLNLLLGLTASFTEAVVC